MLTNLEAFFEIKNNQCAGVDGMICKLHLVAKNPGRMLNPMLGLPVLIKP